MLLCLTAFASTVAAQAPADAKLPLDAQVRTGRLDNGMTYYIRHHENPRQRADFFIAHNVGALQEEDNQDGLAHFLEHMAFNGTKHFPGKGLLNYLASIGVRFGYNVNAYTSRDRTVYNVSNVPLVRESVVDSLLLILHDWSYYISCEPEEIESERGVIREEWRRGDDARSRMARKTAQFEYAGSKYAERDVIGDPNIINTFERQTLVDFYHKWYRPDLQAVIVVGDVDVDEMEAKIRRTMSSIPKAVDPAPKENYTIPEAGKPRYGVVTDPETKAVAVKLIYRQPYPGPAERERMPALRENLARKIFLEMMRARIVVAEKQPDVRYKRLVAVMGSLATCKNTFQLTGLPKGQNMREALAGMLVDMEQMRRYGFDRTEFEQAKAKVTRAEEAVIERLRQATNTELATAYVEHFTRNEPFMTVEDRARVTGEALSSLRLEDLNRMRETMTRAEDMLIVFSSPDEYMDRVPSEQTVAALMDSVAGAQIASPVQRAKADEPLFDRQVEPGRVVATKKAPYETVAWTLSNGAKVQWRMLPEVTGVRKIGMSAVNEGGFARDTDVEALRMLQNYLRSLGVKELSRTELTDRIFDRDASLTLNLSKHAASIGASSSTGDLETMLQLVNLYITEPNFSEKAYAKFIEQYRTMLEKEVPPRLMYSDSSNRMMYGDHPWLKKVTLASLDRVDAAAARRLYDKVFGNAADWVFFFAGEMPAEEARPLIERYLGSLPAAPRQKYPEMDMEILPGKRDYEYTHEGAQTPKSMIERYYHGKFRCTPENYAALRYVTYILSARYLNTVREEKGGTYYIGVQEVVGVRPRGYCHLVVSFETDPKLCGMLLDEVQRGIERLAAEAPSEQEVNEAMLYFRKVNAERQARNLRTTSYWLGKMQQKYCDGVDFEKDNEAIFTAVKPEDIRKFVRDLLGQGNCFTTVFTQK